MTNFAILYLVAFLAQAAPGWTASPSSAKISPSLLASLSSRTPPTDFEIIVSFGGTGQALNQIQAMTFQNKATRSRATKETLESHASFAQAKTWNLLTKEKSLDQSTRLWISNQIFVKKATPELVKAIAELDEVTFIEENEYFQLQGREDVSQRDAGILAEWGVERIRAPQVWAHPDGNTGEGVIVASIDTGVRGTHEALRDNYGGHWFDPYTSSSTPIDQNGLGTHTMGILCGKGGIGVAPGARWIACRGCDTASCGNAQLLQCAQWVVCPNPGCSAVPDLVSNSWSGGRGNTFFDSAIQAWHAAGVVPLFPVGGSGPACNTANSPGDSAAGVIAVGAIGSQNTVSSFGAKGPSIFGAIKPDICAPGGNINSAYSTSDTAYAILSGTASACPHAAGAVALLKSADPSLSYEEVKQLMEETADRTVQPSGQNCGGIPESVFPNNACGAGVVDAFAAFLGL